MYIMPGYAPVGGICKYKLGVSVVQDTGFHSWSTGAHELGHKSVGHCHYINTVYLYHCPS